MNTILPFRHEEEKTILSQIHPLVRMILPFILVIPFLLIEPLNALVATLIIAVSIIFIFTYYVSVAKSLPFKKRFIKISSISLGVAFVSLLIGLLVKAAFNIDL